MKSVVRARRQGQAMLLSPSWTGVWRARDVLRLRGFSMTLESLPEVALARLASERFALLMAEHRPCEGLDVGDITRRLRHDPSSASRRAWVLALAPGVSQEDFTRFRDAGVSCILVDRVTTEGANARLRLMELDRRKFIVSDNYVGPDRRRYQNLFPAQIERRQGTQSVSDKAEGHG